DGGHSLVVSPNIGSSPPELSGSPAVRRRNQQWAARPVDSPEQCNLLGLVRFARMSRVRSMCIVCIGRHGARRTSYSRPPVRPRWRAERRALRPFRKWLGPGLAWQDQGLCALTDTAEVDSVADIHPSEAAHPSPAARCNHHEAAEAASPVAVAVI